MINRADLQRWSKNQVATARMTAAIRRWFANRSLREQQLFALLAATAIVVLLVGGVLRPFERARARLLAEIHGDHVLERELRAAGPLLGNRPQRAAGDFAVAVQGAAEKAGLTLERIEPEGGRMRLTLADVPFPAVVDFLSRIKNESSISADEVRIDAAPDPAHVDAQLLLRR